MAVAREGQVGVTRGRMIVAAILLILVITAVWRTIEYRTQPPPPPNAVETR